MGEGGDRARISVVDELSFVHLGHTSQCQYAKSTTLPRDGPSEFGEKMPTGPLVLAQRSAGGVVLQTKRRQVGHS